MHFEIYTLLLFLSPFVASSELSFVFEQQSNSYRLVKGRHDNFSAYATLKDSINKTGWAYLNMITNPAVNDTEQAYGSGFLEGYVSQRLAKMSWHNTLEGYCVKPLNDYCQRLKKFVDTNFKWMQQKIIEEADKDPYWHQVKLFIIQLQGMIDGLKFSQPELDVAVVHYIPTKFHFHPDITGPLLGQLAGDLMDLEQVLKNKLQPLMNGAGHCSALVKLSPGNRELFSAQDTWAGYNMMLRMLKRYSLGYHLVPGSNQLIPGRNSTFSSYPGILMSGDDFYTISSSLVTMETTIGNSNKDRWKYIQPVNSVFEGIRSLVANRLATNGKQWTEIFSQFNSGTYNNQWMVVDYNKFRPGAATLTDGLLYVLEQIPGMIKSNDATDVLRKQSYWPSYNVAFFPEIFNASGGPAMVAKYGDFFSYEHSPRARIFRRDHHKVVDMDSAMRFMRYNNFKHDPLSACNCTPPYSGENAISARCDLNPANGTYPFGTLGHRSHGGLDAKITSSVLIKSLEFVAVSGPTYDQVPAFQWSKSDYEETVPHVGQPDLWKFKPVLHKWKP